MTATAEPTAPTSALDDSGESIITTAAAADARASFRELHETPLLPWHVRAYTDGPRPVPPAYSATEKIAKWRCENAQYMRDVASGGRPKKYTYSRQRPKKRAPPSQIDWSQRDQDVVETLKQQVASAYARCRCVQCTIVRRESEPAVDYRCPVRYCHVQFRDFVELFEHQVAEHGSVMPHCRRVRMELFGQDRGVVPYPPVTVYAGQQLMRPGYCPTKWTLARVDEEAQTLHGQLFGKTVYAGAIHVWDAFKMAYHHVRQGGTAQLDAQYSAALEHYNSSLVHGVTTRTFQDGAAAVGDGRNWLLSPELPHAERLAPFSAVKRRDPNDCTTYRFAQRDGVTMDHDANDNDNDDSDSDGESASTLLLETGDPVASLAPPAPAVVPDLVAKRLAAVPPWQRFLEPADVKIAHAIRERTQSRKRSRPRCRNCGRTGHDNHKSAAAAVARSNGSIDSSVPKPRCVRRCTLCGEPGHKRPMCPSRVKSDRVHESAVMRCSNCGLRGHTRKNCYQVPLFGIGGAVAT